MPIHDWTRVGPHRFHDFRSGWIVNISRAMNGGLLPAGHYSLIQRRPATERHVSRDTESDALNYARRADRIAVFDHATEAMVSVIDIVSPGVKEDMRAARAFIRSVAALAEGGVHVLLVDLFPPTPGLPQRIDRAVWSGHNDGEPFILHAGELSREQVVKPLTLVSCAARTAVAVYVEPVAVGGELPDLPVFLTTDRYVSCPLAATYQSAWDDVPAPFRPVLEAVP